MFKHTSKLLKIFAWITAVVGIAGSWFYLIWGTMPYILYYGSIYPRDFVTDLLIAVGGTFVSWAAGALIFGMAKLIENTAATASYSKRQVELLEKLTGSDMGAVQPAATQGNNAPMLTGTERVSGSAKAVCPQCGNRQDNTLGFCRICGTKMNLAGEE